MKVHLRDARLAREEFRAELRRRAHEAGWQEIGGRIIREDSTDCKSPVVGRTKWIPYAEWFARMQQDDGARVDGGREAVAKAVDLALRGWRMTPQQRRTVKWLLNDFESFAQWQEEEARGAAEQFGDEFAEEAAE